MTIINLNLLRFIQMVSDKMILPSLGIGFSKQITFTNLRKARIIFPK